MKRGEWCQLRKYRDLNRALNQVQAPSEEDLCACTGHTPMKQALQLPCRVGNPDRL